MTPGHKQTGMGTDQGAAVHPELETQKTKVFQQSPLARLVTGEAVTGTKPTSPKALTQKRLRPPANDSDYLAACETV